MTYFIHDDTQVFDEPLGLVLEATREREVEAAGIGQELGCLFPEDHDPRHPKDMLFHCVVRLLSGGTWNTDITEARMLELEEQGHGVMTSSQFDFWWEG